MKIVLSRNTKAPFYVGYVEVEKMCDLFHIDLRTGCFCNQGACLMYLGLNDQILFGNYENGKVCGDKADLIDGRPVGSVRISFSRLSTENDLDVFKSMVECCFLHSFDQKQFPEGVRTQLAQLSQICIYPIKSCGAYRIRDSWKLNELGLEFDRLWMVVGADGVPVNQKRSRALCFIRPSISKDKMIVADADNNCASLELSLDEGKEKTLQEYIVCSDSVVTVDCGEDAAQWLESFHPDDFLGCRLLRQVNSSQHRECRVATAILNLSNQAPFLLINRASAAYLANIISLPTEEIIARFRANFVIDCETAFEEDNFAEIHVGSIEFEVISKCTRCQMICIDQETGIKDPNLLLALRDRRIGEQMTFGLYLKHRESDREKTISVGSYAKIIRKND
ncbi:hypothetical protein L596_015105 [Steinernema carpocapsae]|uniref:MOSC domain-containing protein n=1 Tax=Steinernema carpocapsae TaxID=34508 RepID=A0A4U5NEW4_STECR|nr:hypothetical protein L596_015105 [Steinernema carpocapsae]